MILACAGIKAAKKKIQKEEEIVSQKVTTSGTCRANIHTSLREMKFATLDCVSYTNTSDTLLIKKYFKILIKKSNLFVLNSNLNPYFSK